MNTEAQKTKRILVIVDHPSYDSSVINRRWVEELQRYPDEFFVHNLQSAYPSGRIDSAREHSLIDNTDTLVFQFPLYWYFCPPKTKQWFETVLTRDWAFGKLYHLEKKKIGLAITCGSEEEAYSAEGRHHYPISSYLLPISHSLEMCKAEIRGMYVFYGAQDKAHSGSERIVQSAAGYVEFLRKLNAGE